MRRKEGKMEKEIEMDGRICIHVVLNPVNSDTWESSLFFTRFKKLGLMLQLIFKDSMWVCECFISAEEKPLMPPLGLDSLSILQAREFTSIKSIITTLSLREEAG